MYSYRRSLAVYWLASIALCISLAPGAFADDARRLHIIIAADTKTPDVKWGANFDGYRMYQYFLYAVPYARRGDIDVLHGNVLSENNLLQAIRNRDIANNDALLVYYCGHGAFYGHQHALDLPSGDRLRRSVVLDTMKQKGARLNVLLTDSCANEQEGALAKAAGAPDMNPPYLARNVCRYLFFRSAGLVDINSASRGETAFSNKAPRNEDGSRPQYGDMTAHGGLFTSELVKVFTMDDESLREQAKYLGFSTSDSKITWDLASGVLKRGTDEAFKMLKSNLQYRGLPIAQKHQMPAVFSGASIRGDALSSKIDYRVGIRYQQGNGGARITTVYRDTNAEWVGLRPGDTIVGFQPLESAFWQAFGYFANRDRGRIRISSINDMTNAMWRDLEQAPGLQSAVGPGMWKLRVRRGGSEETLTIYVPWPTHR